MKNNKTSKRVIALILSFMMVATCVDLTTLATYAAAPVSNVITDDDVFDLAGGDDIDLTAGDDLGFSDTGLGDDLYIDQDDGINSEDDLDAYPEDDSYIESKDDKDDDIYPESSDVITPVGNSVSYVQVKLADDYYRDENYDPVIKTYSNLAEAVNSMGEGGEFACFDGEGNEVADPLSTYEFTFIGDQSLTANVTLPDFVNHAVFTTSKTGDTWDHSYLNLNGKTITFNPDPLNDDDPSTPLAVFEMSGNLSMVSPEDSKGNLNIQTGNLTVVNKPAFPELYNDQDNDASCLFGNVNINMPETVTAIDDSDETDIKTYYVSGAVELCLGGTVPDFYTITDSQGNPEDHNEEYNIDAVITGGTIFADRGTWNIRKLKENDLFLRVSDTANGNRCEVRLLADITASDKIGTIQVDPGCHLFESGNLVTSNNISICGNSSLATGYADQKPEIGVSGDLTVTGGLLSVSECSHLNVDGKLTLNGGGLYVGMYENNSATRGSVNAGQFISANAYTKEDSSTPTVMNLGDISAGSMNFAAGTFTNAGNVNVNGSALVNRLNLIRNPGEDAGQYGGWFNTQTFTMSADTNSALAMVPGTGIQIQNSGSIYNLMIDQDIYGQAFDYTKLDEKYQRACINRFHETTLAINGSVDVKDISPDPVDPSDPDYVPDRREPGFAVVTHRDVYEPRLDENNNPITDENGNVIYDLIESLEVPCDPENGVVITTDIKKFPTQYVFVHQPDKDRVEDEMRISNPDVTEGEVTEYYNKLDQMRSPHQVGTNLVLAQLMAGLWSDMGEAGGEGYYVSSVDLESLIDTITDPDEFNSYEGFYHLEFFNGGAVSLLSDIVIPSNVKVLEIGTATKEDDPNTEHDESEDHIWTNLVTNGHSITSSNTIVLSDDIHIGYGQPSARTGSLNASTLVIKAQPMVGASIVTDDLIMESQATLIAEDITVKKTASLTDGNMLAVNKKGSFKKVELITATGKANPGDTVETLLPTNAVIARGMNAALAIDGEITRDSGKAYLNFGVYEQGESYDPVDPLYQPDPEEHPFLFFDENYDDDYEPDETNPDRSRLIYIINDAGASQLYLFTTGQKTIPGFLGVWQPARNSYFRDGYEATYLEGGKVYAGKLRYTLLKEEDIFNPQTEESEYAEVVINNFITWKECAAAITAINDRSGDYKLVIRSNDEDVTKTIALPKAAYSFVYESEVNLRQSEGKWISDQAIINYTSSTKMTGNLTLDNMDMRLVDRNGETLSPYSVATFNMDGYNLTMAGQVYFDSALVINDSKKAGRFEVKKGGSLFTARVSPDQTGFEQDTVNWVVSICSGLENTSVIAGSLNNIGNVVVNDDQYMAVTDYKTKQDTFASGTATITKLDNRGTFEVSSLNSYYNLESEDDAVKTSANAIFGKGKATVTYAYMHGKARNATWDNVLMADALSITNLYLEDGCEVRAAGAFDVTNLTCWTSEAVLTTNQNGNLSGHAKNTPYLNVSGSVILGTPGDKVQVKVMKAGTLLFNEDCVELKPGDDETKPTGSMQLLTAKNGTADQFVPYHAAIGNNLNSPDSYQSNIPAECYLSLPYDYQKKDVFYACFGASNLSGYFLQKKGNNIYLYTGEDVGVAVATLSDNDTPYLNSDTVLRDIQYKTVSYYLSWADAIAAVDALKTKQRYEFVLLKDVGSANEPVSLSFPKAANISGLFVIGTGSPNIYYTNALSLTSDTTICEVGLVPVKKYAAKATVPISFAAPMYAPEKITMKEAGYVSTALPVNAGGFNLTLTNISQARAGWNLLDGLTNVFDNEPLPASDAPKVLPGIGAITGNGKNTLTLNLDPYFAISGGVTKFESVTCNDPVWINGNLQANNVDARITNAAPNNSYTYYVAGNFDVKGLLTCVANPNAPTDSYGNKTSAIINTSGTMNVGEVEAEGWTLTCNKSFKATKVTARSIEAGNGGAINVGDLTADRCYAKTLTADIVSLKQGDFPGLPAKVTVKKLTLEAPGSDDYTGVLLVCGTLNVTDTLTLKNGATIDVTYPGSTFTVANIDSVNDSGTPDNLIKYSRKAVKNNNYGTSPVTISGTVTGVVSLMEVANDEHQNLANVVNYMMGTGAGYADISANTMIANIGSNPTSAFKYTQSGGLKDEYYGTINGTDSNSTGTKSGLTLVKSGTGLYFTETDGTFGKSTIVLLTKPGNNSDKWQFIDYNQAVLQINTFNEPNARYNIGLLPYSSAGPSGRAFLNDTIVTDKNIAGTFPLPAQNKAQGVTVYSMAVNQSGDPVPVVVTMTGNITGYSDISFYNIQFSVNKSLSNTDDGITNITISRNNAKTAKDTLSADLTVSNLYEAEKMNLIYGGGQIGKVTVSNLKLLYRSLKATGAVSISGILDLESSALESEKQVTVNNVLTVGHGSEVEESFIIVNQNNKGLPQFTINGQVRTGYSSERLYVKVKDAEGNMLEGTELLNGVPLVMAPNADPAMIRAHAYISIPESTIISYRNPANYIVNESLSNMLIKITVDDDDDDASNDRLLTYARTWNDAVTAINNANAGVNTDYTLTFLQPGFWTANSTVSQMADTKAYPVYGSYGTDGNPDTKAPAALTYPKATVAGNITINRFAIPDNVTDPKADEYKVALISNAKFAPLTSAVVGDRMIISETAYDKVSKTYPITDKLTLVIAAGKTVRFMDYACTSTEVDPSMLGMISTIFTSVTGDKGTLILDTEASAYVEGPVKLMTLELHKVRFRESTGKAPITVTNLKVFGKYNYINSYSNIDITDISGNGGDDAVEITYWYSKPTSKAPGTSPLNIKGNISNVSVALKPMLPMKTTINGEERFITELDTNDPSLGNERYMLAMELSVYHIDDILVVPEDGSLIYKGEKGWFDRRLMTAGNASLDGVSSYAYYNKHADSTGNKDCILIKSGSGVYMTETIPTYGSRIKVLGYQDNGYTTQTYSGNFINLNDAFSEIDRIGSKTPGQANSYAEVRVCADLGTPEAPIGAMTLPSKVAGIKMVGYDVSDPDSAGSNPIYPVICSSGTALALKTDTELKNLTIKPVTKDGLYSITGNKLALSVSNFTTGSDIGSEQENVYIKDMNVGTFTATGCGAFTVAGNINATGFKLNRSTVNVRNKGTFKATDVEVVESRIDMTKSSGTFTATNGTFNYGTLQTKGDISFTTIVMPYDHNLIATEGGFKCNDMTLYKTGNELKVGGTCSLMNVKGTTATTGTDMLGVSYRFSAPKLNNKKEPVSPGASLLTIGGTIEDGAKLVLEPSIPVYDEAQGQYVYDAVTSPVDYNAALKYFDTSDYGGNNTLDKSKRIFRGKDADSYAYFNQSLAKVPKASLNGIGVGNGVISSYTAPPLNKYKYGQNLYLASERPAITVTGYAYVDPADGTYFGETYEGSFFELSEAVAEIERIGSKTAGTANSNVEITLNGDVGSEAAPIGNITLPGKVSELTIKPSVDDIGTIYTTGTTLTLKTPTVLKGVTIVNRAKGKGSKVYNTSGTYNIAGGKNTLAMYGFNSFRYVENSETGHYDIREDLVKDITCGPLEIQDTPVIVTGNITVGNLVTQNTSDPYTVYAAGNLTADNLSTVSGVTVYASNITVKNLTSMDGGMLRAGTSYEGDAAGTQAGKAKDGKITLKDVEIKSDGNAVSVKKASNGIGQLVINGTVSSGAGFAGLGQDSGDEDSSEPIEVEIRENTALLQNSADILPCTKPSAPSEGMLLVTAKLVSDNWFRPSETMKDMLTAQDPLFDGGTIYKKGTGIYYSAMEPEVRLAEMPYAVYSEDHNNDGIIDGYDYSEGYGTYTVSDFMAFEDATAEINSLSRLMPMVNDGKNSRFYKYYAITLLRDIDITKPDGTTYQALTLPNKTWQLAINGDGHSISFLGGVSLKSNLYLSNNVKLLPLQLKSGHYEPANTVLNLGTYRLGADSSGTEEYTPIDGVTNVTGGKGSKLELFDSDMEVSGNISVQKIGIYPLSRAIEVSAGGNLTATDIIIPSYSTGATLMTGGKITAQNLDITAKGCKVLVTSGQDLTVTGATFVETNGTYPKPGKVELMTGGNAQFGDIDGSLGEWESVSIYVPLNKPAKITGTVTTDKWIYLIMGGTTPYGTVYATGPKLYYDDWRLADSSGKVYFAFVDGSNLKRGNMPD